METSMSNSSAEQGGWGLVFIVCLIPFYVHRYKILAAISAFFEKLFIFIGYALLYAGSAAAICAVIWFIFNGVKTMFRRRRQEKEDERPRQEKALLNADSKAQKAIKLANTLERMVKDLNTEVERLNLKTQQFEENLATNTPSVTNELEVG
jgi:predicted membrane protein